MKIMFTGGGSGGHFYPIIAVAEAIHTIVEEERLLPPELYFAGPDPYSKKDLFEANITFVHVSAGKIRRYFSIRNLTDLFITGWGILKALVRILIIFPDVIFGKGGYGSFPTLLAGKLFGIPVIIHESDSAPGRVNLWAGKFAKKVAISFPAAGEYFDSKKTAFTGNPIRKDILTPLTEGAREFLKLDEKTPVLFVQGGSQGAKVINDTIIEALPELLKSYYVIHQTGRAHFDEDSGYARVVLGDSPYTERYKAYDFLDVLALRMAAGAADLIISRAGASAIYEIAAWSKPSIIIPITDSNLDHQRKNAFTYARSGAAIVIEEVNLTPNLLVSEINRLMGDLTLRNTMATQAKEFAAPDAARKIAREILDLALEHEK